MNKDARPDDYAKTAQTFRPSHADFTYEAKYGIRNWQGGGRASARETIGRVAAGAVARKVLLKVYPGFEALAYVIQVCDLAAAVDPATVTRGEVEANAVRCPDSAAAARMMETIHAAEQARGLHALHYQEAHLPIISAEIDLGYS
jgi:chorismate synthase